MSKFSNIPNAKCWRCGVEVQCHTSVLCSICHQKEVEKVHQHDTPTIPEVEPIGGKYIIPISRATRPTSRGRRVIKDTKTH